MNLVRYARAVGVATAVALGLAPAASRADTNYPSKPVQIVSAFAAGSATDLVARVVADKLGQKLAGQVYVTSKPGASGILATETVAKSAPDGYTLLVTNPSIIANTFLFSRLPFNLERDFAGVSLIGESPYVVIVTPELGVKTIQELVQLARSKPKSINYASGGLGTAMHLTCELLARRAGIELTVVPYANVANIGTDFQTNRVQMMCVPIPSAMQFVRPGKAIPLGVTSSVPLTEPLRAPSIQQATGLEVLATSWNGLLAPARTPPAVMQKLAKAMEDVLQDPEVRQKLMDAGLTPNPVLLKDFDAYLRKELEVWGPVVKATGVKLD